MTKQNFRLTAAWCAIISMFLAFGSIVVGAAALNFDPALFNEAMGDNATAALALLANNPSVFWWPAILDFFGFYLLLLPLTLYLHGLFKEEAPEWMDLFTVCGLGYILFGAMGAATLAVVFFTQAADYATATESVQQIHTVVFEAFGDAIQRGVWGILDPILAGIWWTGLGLLLRKRHAIVGWYTFVLGLVNLVGGISAALQIDVVASICLNVYFLMAPLWAGWLGLLLLRKDKKLSFVPSASIR